ncbi:hypothetical protein H310_06636 [Aphanomyces invadans]|uniref:THH1/TOM1/TOM3 domain-containing protein n=1 Tax=Aphanomyces invadans TaxID=157072 RepID=A0A024U456_9STRA|nr:hypothetical protein H310_06636 [Aphanomyces invadans]ETW01000.1 hypothetical protein H310_06636 [Aphanomyces invadans]|eukprot:XP_008869998.1 hypothetical protein H310_06636 [Aphanomyces invadans]
MGFQASMGEFVELPTPTTSITILCETVYVVVGLAALYRSVVPQSLPITRLKVFQYLVGTFSLIRSMSFVTDDSSARNIINRLALCIFFSLVLFQVFFWFDIVNPAMSARSKRIWNTYLAVNFVFYVFVLVLQLVSPAAPIKLDKEPRVHINFWSDLLPALLVALGSLGCAGGMLYLSWKMRLRVQRLVGELPDSTIQALYRALAFLNTVLLLSSGVFALRTVLYFQRPWSNKECGAIQNPNMCILVGYVLPEMVPCVLFLALMRQVDSRLWTSSFHAPTAETTPLLRKQPSTVLDSHNQTKWQRPLKSHSAITIMKPQTHRIESTSPLPQLTPPSPHIYTSLLFEPALYLSIRCLQLNSSNQDKTLGGQHSDGNGTFVVATSTANAAEIARTDVCLGESPIYHVLLNVPRRGDVIRLQVYAVRSASALKDSAPQLLGEVVLRDLQSLVPGRAQSFRLDDGALEHSPWDPIHPSLSNRLLVARCEAYSTIEPTSQRMTRAFGWQEVGWMAEEELVESPFTWSIPFQLLQVILVDLTEKLNQLRSAAEVETSSSAKSTPSDDNRSLLSDMIYHLQGNKRNRTNHKWRVEMIQCMEKYMTDVEAALLTYAHDTTPRCHTFKPSTKKADPELRFVALNLHAQLLTLGSMVPEPVEATEAGWDEPTPMLDTNQPPFAYHHLFGTVTVGAFAAHVYGFSQGGIRQLRENWERLRDLSTQAIGADLAVLQRDMHALEWHIDQRLDVAFSQALTALVTSFQQTLYVHMHNSSDASPFVPRTPALYLKQLQEHGFLFSVESLLSTVGAEAGMLGDMDAAVKALAHVTIQVHAVPPATSVDVQITPHGPNGLVISLPIIFGDASTSPLPSAHRIPGQDRASGAVYKPPFVDLPSGLSLNIHVVPVLFNQGMNEVQTVANKVGRSQLQEDINVESSRLFEAYLEAISAPPSIMAMWATVKAKIEQAKPEKVMDIVATTSWIARHVGGGRVTCCKSGKDRTAMSVTLEEATWMVERARSCPSASVRLAIDRDTDNSDSQRIAEWTQLLRTYGVRRENARKNIGTAQYAFNAWQNYLLPPEYKCPPGTGGGGKS